jgi:hypothetical protein
MGYRRLFLFLEGEDDRRFFEAVLIPLFESQYDHILPVLVSRLRKESVLEWLRSAESMGDYIFVRDLDLFPCVTAVKEALQKVYPRLRPARIQVVKAEIESWYCAGLKPEEREWLTAKVAILPDTEEVTKEQIASALKGDRVDALTGMLKRYDLQLAARRNGSLRYFLTKHLGMAG